MKKANTRETEAYHTQKQDPLDSDTLRHVDERTRVSLRASTMHLESIRWVTSERPFSCQCEKKQGMRARMVLMWTLLD